MATRKPPAPRSIGKNGARLWRRVLDEFEVSDGELALLEAAAGCYQRLVEAQEAIAKDGLVLDTPSGPKTHPAAPVARDSANLLGKLLKQLGVEAEEDSPQRYRVGAKPGPRPRALRSA
jgi:P27 family predicted phage terminase small subunit